MNVSIRARPITAALLIGAAILGLVPGQATYAAGSNPQEAVRIATVDPNSGGGPEGPGSPSDRKKRKHPVDSFIRCSITHSDGSIDFYLPGEAVARDGRMVICGDNGQWKILPRSGGAGDTGSPTTGTNAP
jgi:hypothetical protein